MMKWTSTFLNRLDLLKDKLRTEIEDIGGLKVFISTLLIFPFALFYLLLLRPLYDGICTLIDIKEYGLKTAFRKNFYSDEYRKEESNKEYERRKALEEPLIEGRKKKFNDRENWPDAFVVDGKAVYGAEGRTLIFVDENVEEFDVPEGVENIYHRCFALCDKLKKVNLPSSLKRIGKRAFGECVSLKEIIVPESVAFLDEEMFMDCVSLEKVVLPSHTKEIPTRTFNNCRHLRYFELPKEVRLIETEVFRRCYLLEQIKTNEKLELIGEKAFEDCHSLKEFIMSETVRTCSLGMFNGCHSLQHIHLSSQIKDFGGSCCHDCWEINQISMPFDKQFVDSVKKSWEMCANIVNISNSENPIPNSKFWTMGDTLYFGIPRLSDVWLLFCFSKEQEYTIPSFVTEVKREAFTSCKNLRTLRLSPNLKSNDFSNVSYEFIYEYWPQIENVIFDDSLSHTGFHFELTA